MKILFISNYYDNTGWAHAAQSYILAMDAVGINVIPRAIKLNNIQGEVPARILELEKRSDKNCDIVIQNVLPHMMTYSGKFEKNIGLCYIETESFRASSWPQYLNAMDEVWVPSRYNAEACDNSFVNKPVHIVPVAVDKQKFLQGYQPLDIPAAKNNFTFYFIGEHTTRKNLVDVLRAFHLEFRQSEPVHLVIKTSMPGVQQYEAQSAIQQLIQQTKQSLKLYKSVDQYKKETLILDHFSQQEMCQLHATCDCLVAPSLGESWSIPCQEAMLFGNTPIYTNGLGMDDYCVGGEYIESVSEPAIGALDTFSDLCTGYDKWRRPELEVLQERMRTIYENKERRDTLCKAGLEQLDKHSYGFVGNIIKDILNGNI